MDMTDVRKALWDAYKALEATPDGIDGKSTEAWCSLCYPDYWVCENFEEFSRHCQLIVCSYALGPGRTHYFIVGDRDEQVNYYTWKSPDIFAKAVEVIGEWRKEQCE